MFAVPTICWLSDKYRIMHSSELHIAHVLWLQRGSILRRRHQDEYLVQSFTGLQFNRQHINSPVVFLLSMLRPMIVEGLEGNQTSHQGLLRWGDVDVTISLPLFSGKSCPCPCLARPGTWRCRVRTGGVFSQHSPL